MIAAANLIPLVVILPLGGAFLISILGRRVKWSSEVISLLITLSLLLVAGCCIKTVNHYGMLVYNVGAWKPPVGIAMVLDGLSAFMLLTVNLVAFAIAIYSVDYMRRYTSIWKFFTLFLLMLAGMNGVIITGDLFNLYVFLEIAALASFTLVAFGTGKHELEAAFKYAVMSTVGSVFLLLGIALLYSYTSTLNMADMADILRQKGPSNVLVFVSILFVMGFGVKAALVPFHAWLPDAHPSAPAPISAMLSGVLIKSLGIYALCRVFFNVIGMTHSLAEVLMFLGTLSMLVGMFLAIGQMDVKRLMAYSSISQIGYIVLGLGLGTPLGVLGALFHLFNHSVFKSLLFLNAGALDYATGTRDLAKMGGLMKKMPVTGRTNLIAAMSIAGIPPFSGFWSKLIIILAAVLAGKYWYAFWAVVASILTLVAFTKILKLAYFGKSHNETAREIKEVPVFMRIAMVMLCVITVFGGMLVMPRMNVLLLKPAADVILEGMKYAQLVLMNIK